ADIFGDMVEAFLRELRMASVVVESGFGWNDRGMSMHLKRHLHGNPNLRLMLLHRPYFNARFMKPNFHGSLFRSGQLVFSLRKYLGETSWKEITSHLLVR